MSKRFAAEVKRLEETRFANQRVPASAIIDQLRGAQVAPASSGERGTVALSAATPAALGTAAAGGAGTASDGGHVHGHGDLSAAGGTMHSPAQAGAEPALGNPGTSGFVLSSTTAGARSWVAPSADVGAAIHAASAKTTPVDADETALADSAASYGLKKVTWSNIKATLKAYFDGLYAALTHKSRHATGGADALSPADIGAATTSAASLTSGALDDARLSAYVAMRNAANTFSADQVFDGNLLLTKGGSGSIGPSIAIESASAGAVNSEFFLIAAGQGSGSAAEGPYFGMRGNTYSRTTHQRGYLFFVAGDVATPSSLDGVMHFMAPAGYIEFQTGSSYAARLRIDNAGNVLLLSVPRNPSAGTISGYASGTVYADASNFLKVK